MTLEEYVSRKIEREFPYLRYADNPIVEKLRPKMEEFKGDHDYEENKKLLEDQQNKIEKEEVERQEIGRKRSKENEMKSKALEGFFVLEGKKIFGKEAETILTSRFDDVLNKIDLVIELPFEGKIIRLGIDVTVSDVEEHIEQKERNNQDRINKRQINIRYFKSILEPKIKGELKDIPRAVIAISSDFLEDFISKINNPKTRAEIRFNILQIIKIQLENQLLYTLKRNKERMEVEGVTKKTGVRFRLRRKYQEKVNNFYDLVDKIYKGEWDKASSLISLFEENDELFKKENIMKKDAFEFVSNIKKLLKWIGKNLEKFTKENAASSEATLLGAVSHWKAEDF